MPSDRYLAERLPWLLNGSLGEEESAEVQRLLAESAENRQELKETEDAARVYGHRLPSEVVIGYAFDGEHPDVPTDLLERYLSVSPVGAAELELVRESQALMASAPTSAELPEGVIPFERPASAPPVTGWPRLAMAASILGVLGLGLAGWQWMENRESAGELARAEQQLRELLAAEDGVHTDEEMQQRVNVLETENSQLAAGKSDLVDQIAQKDEEIESLGDRVAALSEPQINVPVIDLFPGDMVLRGEEEEQRLVVVPRQTRSVALILNSSTSAGQRVTGLVILDAEEEEVWRSPVEPERDELGTFTVTLPVQRLESGRYTLQLIDGQEGRTQVVETYQVEIR